MRRTIIMIIAVAGILVASCTKTDTMNTTSGSLKQSVSNSVSAVNDAVGTIASSKAYDVLSANAVALKSTATYTDSVTLASVAGIYQFQPDLVHIFDFFIPHRLFVKTGTSDHMIVYLPQKLVIHPRFMRELEAPDTLLKNDFKIDASDYFYFFNYSNKFEYRLAADLWLDTISLGGMRINAMADPTGQTYTSAYNFQNGYAIAVSFQNNDTTTTTFTLSKGDNALMRETVVATHRVMNGGMGDSDEFRHRERLYILDIGNVEIRRGGGLDSIQVYLDGVLQKHAGAKIVDSTGTDGSIFHHRDIQLKFDDGTTTNLSTLLDPAKEALKTLVDALHSMNFAKNVVDYIAIGIDFDEHHHHD